MTPEMRELYNLEGLWGDAPAMDDLAKLDNASQKEE
jgi:ribosomal silencing factor RsfS